MFLKKVEILAFITLLFCSTSVVAKLGTETGGGGDASEARVNEIREDILNWIKEDGAKGLVLSDDLSYDEYISNMTEILKPKKVKVSFTEDKVIYSNAEKTCKGFLVEDNKSMHILCNVSRFAETPPSDQYKLIHHEYAGLARIENNDGAASDYYLSSQITDFLTSQKVLRLSIKKVVKKDCTIHINDEYFHDLNYYGIIKKLKKNKFTISTNEDSHYSLTYFDVLGIIYSNTTSDPALKIKGTPDANFNEMFAKISMINNETEHVYNLMTNILSTDKKKPTVKNAIARLLETIPTCQKIN